jgi:GDP/UDP-N,N'-diacetylbacillosamine 2-epimerase (hydrolysing)
MKTIHLITTARSDFSIWKPIFKSLNNDDRFQCKFVVTGSHYLSALGNTYQEVYNEVPVEQRIELSIPDVNDPDIYLPSMFAAYSKTAKDERPDAVFFLGDRFELLMLLSVAINQRLPIVHIYGGEFDAAYCMDTQVRDAVTKAAHIHFVSHGDMRRRLQAMGEEDWRICVSGNQGEESHVADKQVILEYLHDQKVSYQGRKLVNCCYHPPTTRPNDWKTELPALFQALDHFPDCYYIWTGVNADPGADLVRNYILEETSKRENHTFFHHLGGKRYQSLLSNALFMIGNSSSGLLEAPVYHLPSVNIGSRQAGRLHGYGVFDSSPSLHDIIKSIEDALNADRKKIMNVFQQPRFPMNINDHLYNCLERSDIFLKKLLGVNYELERSREYE